ncbi:MAG: hypothetical protein ACYC33_04175 [Thermoleophilia bacterium]
MTSHSEQPAAVVMRPRHLITLVFFAALVAAGVWSFYGNVLNPHDGQTMPGMDMATTETTGAAQADAGAGGAPEESPAERADLLPPQLGAWKLSASVTGEAALLEVEQLHGKALGGEITDAWVGQYGVELGGQPHAMVWISRSPGEGPARELLQRMTDRISEGSSPFTGLRPMTSSPVEGYALDGMGQTHYYFQVGTDLYWLAVDPDQAEVVLDDLIGWMPERISKG